MRRFLTPVLIALLVMYSLQQMLLPTLAPLSHDLGLTATQLSLVFTIAAGSLTLSAPLWGWAFDAIGLRGVLITGLALCVIGLAGFAAAVTFAFDETLTPGAAFTVVLVFRSLLLGAGLAALPVAALAVAGTVTVAEGDRTRAVGLVGAAQGFASVIGPPLGGVLAAASLWLPLYVAPVIALLVAIPILLVAQSPERSQHEVQARPWELLPAFGVGFLLYLSLALVQVVIVFIAADRLETSADAGVAGPGQATGPTIGGVRLSVAIWPPPEIVEVLGALDRAPGVQWSVPAQWLVKVRPLGTVPERVVPDLVEALTEELDGAPATRCVLGPRTRPLSGWISVPVAGLDDLGAVVFEATAPVVPVTHPQPFQAFVVLARGRVPAGLAGQEISAEWIADRIALVADRSSPGRPRFEDLAHFELERPA